MQLPVEIFGALGALTAFLVFVAASQYAVHSTFARTRLVMTCFFFYVVATLTISFWPYAFVSAPYSIAAFAAGLLIGHLVAVREAQRRLMALGLEHYLEHSIHVRFKDLEDLRWWALINFYSVGAALVLINFIGLSTVLAPTTPLVLVTCAVGAFLVGTLVPYLVHLWSLRVRGGK
ncbi:MAG: hypothetical protein KGI70_02995 [Patescibacteria group bacterium]|nr:hypothetical protein [Patescibacteria group bacterium]